MRTYISDLPGGTATTTIQMTEAGTLKEALVSLDNVAAGKLEISLAPSPQIGTTQPTSDVLARLNLDTSGSPLNVLVPLQGRVKAFQSVFLHQTGAGNVGSITIYA